MPENEQLAFDDNQHGIYERLLRPESLRPTPEVLLGILATKGDHPRVGTLQYAREILEQSSGVENLPELAETSFESGAMPEVLNEGRRAILAALELYRRLLSAEPPRCFQLDEPDEVAYHLLEHFQIGFRQHKGDDRIGALLLDPRDRLLREGIVQVEAGDEDKTRTILKAAIFCGASQCIPFGLFWSHPKSHPDDCLGFIEELRKAGAELAINVPDAVAVHVDAGWWWSLQESDQLDPELMPEPVEEEEAL